MSVLSMEDFFCFCFCLWIWTVVIVNENGCRREDSSEEGERSVCALA